MIEQPTLRVLSLGAGVQSTTLLMLSAEGRLPKLDAAIFADTKYLPADHTREHRWDSTDYPEGALVLRTQGSSGRWSQTGYSVVPVPHTA